MGSLQSILSAELIAAGVIIACAAGGYWAVTNGMVEVPVLTAPPPPDSKKANTKERERGATKKGKKKKGVVNEAMSQEDDIPMPGAVRPTAPIIAPELLEPTPTLPAAPTPPPGAAAAKEKKRKAKKEASSTSVTGSATTQQLPPPPSASGSSKPAPSSSKSGSSSKAATAKSTSVDEESWTRVENRRNRSGHVSDTGITTSVTEEEEGGSVHSAKEEKASLEKLMPKKRKTAVDDMLEKGSQPEFARVKRIDGEQKLTAPAVRIQPSPTDKPADGFTWGDYEDVAEDDEAPWTESRSKKPRRNPSTTPGHASGGNSSAPETGPTKKQRQNAAKREAEKKGKQEAEAARLAQLAKYKKEQEKAKMDEQYKQKGSKTLSGGMKASVDASGSLVWD